MEKFGELEESTSWAGRAIDPTMKMKHDLGRTTSRVLEDVEKIRTSIQCLETSLTRRMDLEHKELDERTARLEKQINAIAAHLLDPATPSEAGGEGSGGTPAGEATASASPAPGTSGEGQGPEAGQVAAPKRPLGVWGM